MAEHNRLTNKQRREQAREERRQREAEAARKQKRGQLRNGLITLAIVAIVGAVVVQAVVGGESAVAGIQLHSEAVDEARTAAGCLVISDGEPLEDRSHVEAASQVNPSESYTATRPTHSGPHTVGVHPVTAAARSQIDEITSTHNLEHGSVIVWWDPEQADDVASDIGSWAERMNASGLRRDQAGVGVLSSPYEQPGIQSGKPIAFRAWGTAMDCDAWDEDVAHAFVLDHFGMHGVAPERMLAGPFPEGVLAYEDLNVEDTTEDEAPTDGDHDFELLDPDEVPDGGAGPEGDADRDTGTDAEGDPTS